MLGQRIPFVLAILFLLVVDIYGIIPKEDTRRCPRGTPVPVRGGCNPRTFPSTCPSGYHCYSLTDGPGLCCPDSAKVTCLSGCNPVGPTRPVQPPLGWTCPSGGNPAGPCILFGAKQCPSGHFCSSTSTDGSGTCCPLNMPTLPVRVRCRDGRIPNGHCVPDLANQCAGGFFCQDVPGDRTGICCPTRIVQPPLGSCPVVNNVGPCLISSDSCVSDDHCQQGLRCCPDGCGKVCKYVGGDSYIPRRA